MPIEFKRPPTNLGMVHSMTDRSGVMNMERKKGKRQIMIDGCFAPDYETQLPENIFSRFFQAILGLARLHPDRDYTYIRLDNNKRVKMNESNRPFDARVDEDLKTMTQDGYKFVEGIGKADNSHRKKW